MPNTAIQDGHASDIESVVPGMGRPLPVRLSRIQPDPNQPRKSFPQKSIEEMADSLQEHGQKTPVPLRTDPDKKGYFFLIGGERRWRGFQLIQQRTGKEPTMNAFIEVVNPKEQFKRAFLDNLLREDLLPLETASALHKLHHEDGETHAALAKLVSKSSNYVADYIKLHTLPDEVKSLMDPGRNAEQQLSVTSAIDIAKSTPDQKLRISIARETVERRLGVVDARTLISMRTGDEGWRVGGYQRDSNNDYRAFLSFLGRTRQDGEKYFKLDFEGMYFNRDDEFGDRETDAISVRSIIGTFQRLLEKVEEKEKPLR